MKRILLLFAIITGLGAADVSAQIGVGLGSHGLNIRTDPQSKHGIIVRTGFGFDGNPFESYFRPEAALIRRHHYSDKTKLYAGLGASGEMRLSLSEVNFSYGLMIPIGLELFPLDSKNLSISLETGISFLEIGLPESKLGNYGLIEISFYLGDREE